MALQVLCLRLLCNLAADSLTLTGRPAPGPVPATAAQRLMQELVHVSHSVPLLLQHTLIEADNPYLREYALVVFSFILSCISFATLCVPFLLSVLPHILFLFTRTRYVVLLLKLLGDGHAGVQRDLHALHMRGVAHEDALRAQGLAVTADTDLSASDAGPAARDRGGVADEPRGHPRLRVRTLPPAERAAATAATSGATGSAPPATDGLASAVEDPEVFNKVGI